MRATVRGNRRIIVRELSEDVHIRYVPIQSIITDDLDMRRVFGNVMPKLHTIDQKDTRTAIAQDLLDYVENDGI